MFSQFSNSLAQCSEIFQDIMCRIEICLVTAQESALLTMAGLGSKRLGKRALRELFPSLKRKSVSQQQAELHTRIFKIPLDLPLQLLLLRLFFAGAGVGGFLFFCLSLNIVLQGLYQSSVLSVLLVLCSPYSVYLPSEEKI